MMLLLVNIKNTKNLVYLRKWVDVMILVLLTVRKGEHNSNF